MAEVVLRPMRPEQYTEFRSASLASFALEKARADDLTQEEAEKAAEATFQALVPEGMQTPGQFFFKIVAGDREVGDLWFGRRGRLRAFLYDIALRPEEQGKGYGEAAMRALEVEVRKLGLSRIALHVFGHNTRAQKLYSKLGYEPTDLVLLKVLSS